MTFLRTKNSTALQVFLAAQISINQPLMANDSSAGGHDIFVNDSFRTSVENKEYKVQYGDTLIGIARRFSSEQGVSLWKMLVDLARYNPAAFDNNDYNNMIVGATLQVPGKQDAKQDKPPKAVEVTQKPSNVITRTEAFSKASDDPQKPPNRTLETRQKLKDSDNAIAQVKGHDKTSDSQKEAPQKTEDTHADLDGEIQARYRTQTEKSPQEQQPTQNESNEDEDKPDEIPSTARLGYISNKSEGKSQEETLALGGQFRLQTPVKKGFGAGVGFYSTNALFGENENAAFLGAEGKAYTLAGEAWLAFEAGQTQLKAGRQPVDTPFADTDDIAMVPNTFEGVVVTNNDIQALTLTLLHLRKWASRDNDAPELFTDINGDKGISALGVNYAPTESFSLQAWHYEASDLSKMSYLEMGGGNKSLHLALQYTIQTDETPDGSDTDNNAWGILAEHSIGDFTLSTAYNRVSGEVSNGFGGGPYFTSTEDHTIDGVTDEKATTLGLEYTGFAPLTLALLGTDFDKGEDEVDAIISYAFNEDIHADIIYSDMSDDGKVTKVFLNYDF